MITKLVKHEPASAAADWDSTIPSAHYDVMRDGVKIGETYKICSRAWRSNAARSRNRNTLAYRVRTRWNIGPNNNVSTRAHAVAIIIARHDAMLAGQAGAQ